MKVRIVRETHCEKEGGLIPTMMLNEFEGENCSLICKTVKNGIIKIGLRNSINEPPYKEWSHIRTIYKDEPHPTLPNEKEEIIVYVVEV